MIGDRKEGGVDVEGLRKAKGERRVIGEAGWRLKWVARLKKNKM